jgi:glycosyltransferase involved in cell wall biosynthesis
MNYASLLILSYNRREFLRECINSAHAHTSLPMEIIVHDDGSDDEFLHDEISALLYNRNISSVIMNARGRNEGQGRALNKLAHAATGDILIFSDQDLVFKPGWLEEVRRILDTGPTHIGSLGGFHYDHDPVDHRKMHIRNWTKVDGSITFEEVEDYVGSFMAFTRESWEKFGPFEEYSDAFAEDAVVKRKIFETDGWWNALPPEDIVENKHFGVGPSTVVAKQKDGKVGVTPIQKQPLIINEHRNSNSHRTRA